MKKIRKTSIVSLLLAGTLIVSLLLAGTLLTSCGISQEDVIKDTQEEPIKDELVSKFKKDMDTAEETKEVKEETKEVKEETKEPEKDEPVVKEEPKKEVKKETKSVVKEEPKKEVKKETKPVVKEETKSVVKKETKPIVKDEPQEELKSVEEIAKEVLNGKWGNGEERRNKLEASGYDYYEVQSEVSKLIPPEPEPKPVVKQSSSSSSSSSSSESYSYSAPNNSITIGGYNLPISNNNTQSRLDARYQEVVNWGASYIGYKYNYDGQSIFLAVHRDSYGWLFPNHSSFDFKDAEGNTKTYHLSEVKGPFEYTPYVDDLQSSAMQGVGGDAIYVQTCIDVSGTYKIYIYR